MVMVFVPFRGWWLVLPGKGTPVHNHPDTKGKQAFFDLAVYKLYANDCGRAMIYENDPLFLRGSIVTLFSCIGYVRKAIMLTSQQLLSLTA